MTTLARPGDGRKPFLAGARLGPVEPGVAHPLGATVTPTGVNFGVYAKHATGMDIQFFYAAEDLTPTRVVSLDPAVHRTGEYWHALVPGVGTGTALRLRGARSVGAGGRPALRPDQAAAGPVRSRRRRPDELPAARCRRHRRHGDHDEERRDRHAPVRLGGRRAAQPAMARDRRLRGAPGGDDPRSGVRRPGRVARHLRRPDRQDPVPDRPGHHRHRTAAGLPVRSAGGAGRAHELLGLPADLVLRAARRATRASRARPPRSTSSATWSRRSTGPGWRSSSTSSTTTRPRAARTARRHPSAASPTTTTTCSTRRTARHTSISAAPATRSRATARSSAG